MSHAQFTFWKERVSRALGLRSPQEGRFYENVAAELRERTLKPGLLAQALAEANGEETKARAIYIRLRVAQLMEEDQARQKAAEAVAIAERQRKEAAAIAEQRRRETVERAEREALWAAADAARRAEADRRGLGNSAGVAVACIAIVFFGGLAVWVAKQENDSVRASNPNNAEVSETTSSPVSLAFHNDKTPRNEPGIEIYDLKSAPVDGAGVKTRVTGNIRNGTKHFFSQVGVVLVTFDKEGKKTSHQFIKLSRFASGDIQPFEVVLDVLLEDIAQHRFELDSAQ